MTNFLIFWNVVVKQPRWYLEASKYTPYGRPGKINNMTQNLVSKVGFAPQTAVNESASISRASSIVETNETLETCKSDYNDKTTTKADSQGELVSSCSTSSGHLRGL